MLLRACGSEYDVFVCRFSAVVAPVTNYIMEVLPEGTRDTKPMELAYEDLEKLSGEEVMRICEWLTDKVLFIAAYPSKDDLIILCRHAFLLWSRLQIF